MKTGRMKFFKHNIFNESHKTILEKLIQNSNLKCFLFHAKFIFKTPLIIIKISNICSIYMYIGYPKSLKPWKWISIIQYNCFPIIIRPIISPPLKSHSHYYTAFFLVFTYYSTYKLYFWPCSLNSYRLTKSRNAENIMVSCRLYSTY